MHEIALGMVLAAAVGAGSPTTVRSEDLVLYVQGQRAGTISSVDQTRAGGGWRLVRTASLQLRRGSETLELRSRSECEVLADLTPLRLEYERTDASGTVSHSARFACDVSRACTMTLDTRVGGVSRVETQALAPGATCMSALEVLARQNLKHGFRHQGPAVAEELGVSVPVELAVSAAGHGFAVKTIMRPKGAAAVETVDLVDARGRIIRSETAAMNSVALPPGSPPPAGNGAVLDVLAASTWPGPRLPARLSRIRFELRTAQGELSPVPEDRHQRVIRRDASSAVVEVTRVPSGLPEVLNGAERERALASTPYEPLQDPRILAAAKEARGDATAGRTLVANVTRYVHKLVKTKDLSRAYAPAVTTLETRQGDCTEHSVLTSALLRANGVPTRLVDGVIAFDNKIGYHEWVEAYLDGEGWVAVDPTFGEPAAGPNRVKFSVGSSQSEDLLLMGLSASQAFRGLTVKVVDFDG